MKKKVIRRPTTTSRSWMEAKDWSQNIFKEFDGYISKYIEKLQKKSVDQQLHQEAGWKIRTGAKIYIGQPEKQHKKTNHHKDIRKNKFIAKFHETLNFLFINHRNGTEYL